MIIINQDKTGIFNFEKIFILYVDNWSNEKFETEPNCFCIKAEKSSDNMIYAILGEYKTEERAKEVLQEIVSKYKTTLYNPKTNETVVNVPKVYEMPTE